MADYDIITVGGGIGGSAIAKAMAESGRKVLVLERETKFRDRVRGEWMAPWGVAETKELGIHDTLIAAGGHHTPVIAGYAGPAPLPPRNLENGIGSGSAVHDHVPPRPAGDHPPGRRTSRSRGAPRR